MATMAMLEIMATMGMRVTATIMVTTAVTEAAVVPVVTQATAAVQIVFTPQREPIYK